MKFFAWIVLCWSFSFATELPAAAAQQSSLGFSETSLSAQIVLPTEPTTFPVYALFRDSFLDAVRRAKERVILVTWNVTDGDVATALYSAKLRGLQVKVMLDKLKSSTYSSRHNYLRENGVDVVLQTLRSRTFSWKSVVVIDGDVWEASAAFDDRVRWSVRFWPSSLAADDVCAWFPAGPLSSRFLRLQSVESLAGAKNPTNTGNAERSSGTIQGSLRVPRKTHSSRGLPRETRSTLIEAGLAKSGSDADAESDKGVSAHVPDTSTRESNIPE